MNGHWDDAKVVAAWDFLQIPVLSSDTRSACSEAARKEDEAHCAMLAARAHEWKRQAQGAELSDEHGVAASIGATMTSSNTGGLGIRDSRAGSVSMRASLKASVEGVTPRHLPQSDRHPHVGSYTDVREERSRIPYVAGAGRDDRW